MSAALAGCRGGPESEPGSFESFEAEALRAVDNNVRAARSWVASRGVALDVEANCGSVTFKIPPAAGSAARRHAWWRFAAVGGDVTWRLEWFAAGIARKSGERLASLRWRAPARAHGDCLEWFDLGPVPEGAVEFVARRADPLDAVSVGRIDLLAFATGGAKPVEPRSAWRSDDGRIEVRAGPGARVPDPDWTLKLLRESIDAVTARLGVELDGPVALIALPGDAAGFEASGGFQNGRALFLRDDELHLPWRGYVHELVHVLEEARGWPLPWVWSEGLACALALDVGLSDFSGIEGPSREAARLAQLLAEGDAFHQPGASSRNAALALDSEPRDPALRAAGYSWGTALVRAAALAGGAGFWPRLAAELDRDGALASAARALESDHADVTAQARDEGFAPPPPLPPRAPPRPFLAAVEAAAGVELDQLFRRCGVAPAGEPAGQ